MYRKLYIIYCDKNQHFFNEKLKKFFRNENVFIIYSPFESFKNIDMIEVLNKLLKMMLKKKPHIDLRKK